MSQKTRAQKVAQAAADEYFSKTTEVPSAWTDLVEDYDAGEELQAALDPDLAVYKDEYQRLLDALLATLAEEEQQDLLANLEIIASSWRATESNMAFLLGIAVGRRLALH